MKYVQKIVCAMLTGMLLLCAGCQNDNSNSVYYDENKSTDTTAQEIKTELGKSAQLGGMTLTVVSVRDPEITMESGKMALFFEIEIENTTDASVEANWLNNFSLTVDGTEYAASECCTIPVMKELYDFYNQEAIQEEIPSGETAKGYVACEVDKEFNELAFHYIPKTTDRNSCITVTLGNSDVLKAIKS